MNLSGIHLIPKTVSGQNYILVFVSQLEMGYQRGACDVGTCESAKPGEVVLLKLEIVVSKRPCGLKPSFDIAS